MKIPKNSKFPCSSGKKYKEYCFKYHKGANPKNALILMKNRFSAYAVGDSNYIIKTTHKNSSHYEKNKLQWIKEIQDFSKNKFKKLEIISFEEFENEAFIKFKTYIDNYIMYEKSM